MKSSSDFDPHYNLGNVALYEAIYGENLISLGGHAAIDNMFSGLTINGLRALDVGFGLGGVAFYLAEHYQMQVAGVEIHSWMVEYARAHAPKHLAQLVEFDVYNEAGGIPYPANSFDLVYSKGVLNHVRDKRPLFRQLNSILKNEGRLVIADWIYPSTSVDGIGPLVKETEASYQHVLKAAGFKDIDFRDDSGIFLTYVNNFLQNLKDHSEQIEKNFGAEVVVILRQDHEKLIEEMKHKNKFAIRISAIKSL